MKKILITALIIIGSFNLRGQAYVPEPVKWHYEAKKTSSTEALVTIVATIDDGWRIYSRNMNDEGPMGVTFEFPTSDQYTLVGETTEVTPITDFDKSLNIPVSYFENSAVFKQKIELSNLEHNHNNAMVIKGRLTYMVGNNKLCLIPNEVEFVIPIEN